MSKRNLSFAVALALLAWGSLPDAARADRRADWRREVVPHEVEGDPEFPTGTLPAVNDSEVVSDFSVRRSENCPLSICLFVLRRLTWILS